MKWLIRFLLLFTLCTPAIVVSAISNSEISSRQQLDNNLQVVLTQRKGLSDIVDYLGSYGGLLQDQKSTENQLPDKVQRQQIRSTWVSLLDRLMILDSISQSYEDYTQQDEVTRKRAFRIAYAAFLARYRYVLDFLQITERHPQLHILLNERVAELGLESGTYSKIKFHYLNIAIATEFARLTLSYSLTGEQPGFPLNQGIEEDQAKLWDYAKGKGIKQTVKNGVQIVKDSSFKAFFPVQKGVSEWMGDVRVRRPHQSLITQQQIRTLLPRLEPGDVLLERREWYLSNIGLPGFWPHAALHIGTPEQRRRYFDDEQVSNWLKQQGIDNGELDSLLKHRYPKAYAESLSTDEENHAIRIIEAISEGVVFTSVEHSADADSLAILRPKLNKLAKAKAILQAFHYIGRPYDFNFDFLTDSELVCTELVYKAYEADQDKPGLSLPVVEIMGRLATPANQIVKQFDEKFGSPEQQFELVFFLDGHEKSKTAVESDVADFRQSWKRPKWHIFVQKPNG
ncbi:hypothetical protein A3197_02825 [Candidatus Thiodiazotropha endoloripes]|nr:hypothetical protein A3197_02825 [Candidatus Thiodiazotropha endoloripes]